MSSRLVVLFVPFVVIAIFWLMARVEAKVHRDPTHKSYFERNGMLLGCMFIFLVALWTLFLVVLPYLYMVVESFHPTLRPVERGGPNDVLTLAQYQSFFETAAGVNRVHIGAFVFSILASIAAVVGALFVTFLLIRGGFADATDRHRPHLSGAGENPSEH